MKSRISTGSFLNSTGSFATIYQFFLDIGLVACVQGPPHSSRPLECGEWWLVLNYMANNANPLLSRIQWTNGLHEKGLFPCEPLSHHIIVERQIHLVKSKFSLEYGGQVAYIETTPNSPLVGNQLPLAHQLALVDWWVSMSTTIGCCLVRHKNKTYRHIDRQIDI